MIPEIANAPAVTEASSDQNLPTIYGSEPAAQLQISRFRAFDQSKAHEVHGTHHVLTWEELGEQIRKPAVGGKYDVGILPGTTRENRARNEDVEAIFILGIDIDEKPEGIAALVERLWDRGITSWGHPTYSYLAGTKGPSTRHYIRLSRPVLASEWARFRGAALVDLEIAEIVDPSTHNVSRLFYVTCPPGREKDFSDMVETLSTDGAPLDVDEVLARAPIETTRAIVRYAPDDDEPAPDEVVAWARAHSARTEPAIEGKGGSNVAIRLAGDLVHGLALSRSQALDVMLEGWNGRCVPPWEIEGSQGLRRKIEEATKGTYEKPRGHRREDQRVPALPKAGRHFKCTDFGNAERLVHEHGADLRYCSARRTWFLWDGKRWAPDEIGEIERRAKSTVRSIYVAADSITDDAEIEEEDDAGNTTKETKTAEKVRTHLRAWARTSESKGKLDAMVDLAKTEHGISVRFGDLDADPWALNVENGTIDLRTGALREHRRGDLMTKLAPVTYDPAARSDLWDRFLETATGGDRELAAYLQRATGYTLQGTATEKAFFFLYGPPDTAKSTFVDAIMGTFGTYAVSAAFTTWLVQTNTGGNRGDLVRLAGTRLVTSVEVRPGVRFDQEIVKKVTGGDMITAAAKYEKEVSFPPTFALWLAANDAPAIRDDDAGMWNRVRRVPFDHIIPKEKQDRELRAKLAAPDVRAAILAWAVRGCLSWRTDGLGTCEAIDKSNAEYRKEMDRVAPFFAECLAFDPSGWISNESLRGAYDRWCRENGVKAPVGSKDFAARLSERGASTAKRNGVRGWRGVVIAPDEDRTPAVREPLFPQRPAAS